MAVDPESPGKPALSRSHAMTFIVLLGLVSMFGDMTYEGARSINGPFLATLGAGATVVGIASGFGEFIGYGIRLLSGWLSDRTGRYWPITMVGYGLNLLAVPLLALAGNWQIAVVLIVAERMGRAIRSPARDAMLSHACTHTGLGWGFGLHEALDQCGAMLGPLILSAVLFQGQNYRHAYALLLIPAGLALLVLLIARLQFPRPRDFDLSPPSLEATGFKAGFWLYMIAVACIAAGYADFALIAFHWGKVGAVELPLIPVLYAVAMAADAGAALVLGRWFDRIGARTMVLATVCSVAAPALVFLGGFWAAVLGMVCWGIGMGAQESVMRAAVAQMAPQDRRGTAYGLMNGIYGCAWFGGSVVLGLLYDFASVGWVVAFSSVLQAAAIPVFLGLGRAR